MLSFLCMRLAIQLLLLVTVHILELTKRTLPLISVRVRLSKSDCLMGLCMCVLLTGSTGHAQHICKAYPYSSASTGVVHLCLLVTWTLIVITAGASIYSGCGHGKDFMGASMWPEMLLLTTAEPGLASTHHVYIIVVAIGPYCHPFDADIGLLCQSRRPACAGMSAVSCAQLPRVML